MIWPDLPETMGRMIALGPCWGCGELFEYHPDTVPSLPVDPRTGRPPDVGPEPGGPDRARREPLCPACVARFHRGRKAAGLPPVGDPHWHAGDG